MLLVAANFADDLALLALLRVKADTLRQGDARSLVGPVPSDEDADRAWARVLARELLAIAHREGRQRPWCANELLGADWRTPKQAILDAAADDALCARWLSAQGEGGRRGLDERKRQFIEERINQFWDILSQFAATLAESYLGQVLADVERKGLTSPISIHMNALAWQAFWTRTGEVIPALGTTVRLRCLKPFVRCWWSIPRVRASCRPTVAIAGLVIPTKRFDRSGIGACGQLTLRVCPGCGGMDLGPHHYWRAHRDADD